MKDDLKMAIFKNLSLGIGIGFSLALMSQIIPKVTSSNEVILESMIENISEPLSESVTEPLTEATTKLLTEALTTEVTQIIANIPSPYSRTEYVDIYAMTDLKVGDEFNGVRVKSIDFLADDLSAYAGSLNGSIKFELIDELIIELGNMGVSDMGYTYVGYRDAISSNTKHFIVDFGYGRKDDLAGGITYSSSLPYPSTPSVSSYLDSIKWVNLSGDLMAQALGMTYDEFIYLYGHGGVHDKLQALDNIKLKVNEISVISFAPYLNYDVTITDAEIIETTNKPNTVNTATESNSTAPTPYDTSDGLDVYRLADLKVGDVINGLRITELYLPTEGNSVLPPEELDYTIKFEPVSDITFELLPATLVNDMSNDSGFSLSIQNPSYNIEPFKVETQSGRTYYVDSTMESHLYEQYGSVYKPEYLSMRNIDLSWFSSGMTINSQMEEEIYGRVLSSSDFVHVDSHILPLDLSKVNVSDGDVIKAKVKEISFGLGYMWYWSSISDVEIID